jgi:aspartate racemase
VQADIEAAAGKPMLSMVQCVVDEVTERNWRRVGALTLFGGDMYERALESTVRECLTVEEEIQEPLNRAALAVMAGSETEADKDVARRAVSALRERSVDGIILGCTEFPFLLGDAAEAPDVLNPIKILAEAAVRHAME